MQNCDDKLKMCIHKERLILFYVIRTNCIYEMRYLQFVLIEINVMYDRNERNYRICKLMRSFALSFLKETDTTDR